MEQSRNFQGNSRNNDPKCHRTNLWGNQHLQTKLNQKTTTARRTTKKGQSVPQHSQQYGMFAKGCSYEIWNARSADDTKNCIGNELQITRTMDTQETWWELLVLHHFGSIGYVLGLFDSNLRAFTSKDPKGDGKASSLKICSRRADGSTLRWCPPDHVAKGLRRPICSLRCQWGAKLKGWPWDCDASVLPQALSGFVPSCRRSVSSSHIIAQSLKSLWQCALPTGLSHCAFNKGQCVLEGRKGGGVAEATFPEVPHLLGRRKLSLSTGCPSGGGF